MQDYRGNPHSQLSNLLKRYHKSEMTFSFQESNVTRGDAREKLNFNLIMSLAFRNFRRVFIF